MTQDSSGQAEGYIVEFTAIGNSVKVTVIDPQTSREVSMVGPTTASRQQLIELAIRKLSYVLKRDGSQPQEAGE